MADENINHNDEEELGKAYDSKLMKRLLKYAKPYWKFFVIAVLLLLGTTLTDLAGPYLVKSVIDDNLNGYTKPMVAYDVNKNVKGINFENKVYKTYDKIPENTQSEDIYSIVYSEKKPYLINGTADSSKNGKIVANGESIAFLENGKLISAKLLSQEDIRKFRASDMKAVQNKGLLYILIILIGFLFNFLQIYVLSYAGQSIIYNIRNEVFSHLQKMSLSFFDKNPVGRLVTRVTNDTETLNEMYTNVLVNVLKDVSIIIGVIIIMMSMDIKLSLVVIAAIPPVILATALFRIKARKVYRYFRISLAKLNSVLSENLSGMRIIQIFSRAKEKYKQFKGINKEYYKAGVSQVVVFGIFRPLLEMIQYLTIAAVIWYGGSGVIGGTLKFGVLYAFISYINQFFNPITDMAEKYNILQSAMASSERIFMILDTPVEEDSGDKLAQPTRFMGEIEFRNVWFSYNGTDWVLKDVSFKIPAGNTVAIVGATGAGKTSIINLLNRFYEIQRGDIFIDGVNIKDMKKDVLRQNIGMVLQDVFLFSGTVRDNIRLGEQGIDEDSIKTVSQYVNADKFISKLPCKYDEEVMERGATFSAGQRQLLAFARALAFNPAILVLDEATSNIDTETELLIQDALTRITKNRTTIVIAHRLSTIQHADTIMVFHKGRLREIGNHDELLSLKGMYYNLYNLQYKGS